MASSLIVYVWESRTGTVTITGTVTQDVDNVVGSSVSINHDRVTVINKLSATQSMEWQLGMAGRSGPWRNRRT